MSRRVLIACLLSGCLWRADSFTVPTPRISVLSPRGIRFQIDKIPGVTLIAYHYSFKGPVPGTAAGDYNVDVRLEDVTDDGFVHENGDVAVNDGDTVYYWVHAIYNNGQSTLGYNILNKQWTYRAPTVEPRQLPTALPTTRLRTAVSTPGAGADVAVEVTSTVSTASNENVSLVMIVSLAVAGVLAVTLTIVLAVFCARRAKRLAKTPSPKDLPLRPNNGRPSPPSGFSQTWPANLGSEDPGYEDPDKLIMSEAQRGVDPVTRWSQPVHLHEKGMRPKAPTPSHEYITLTTSLPEVDGGYISPISEQPEPYSKAHGY